MHGLTLGQQYSYIVFDGQSQSISDVKQEVVAYDESDLFPGKAFKVETEIHGKKMTTWISLNGKPLLEMSLGGAMISTLETEHSAKEYLTNAVLNKKESLVEFSLIKSNLSIQEPSQVIFMDATLSELDRTIHIPSDERQDCRKYDNKTIRCLINVHKQGSRKSDPMYSAYLKSSYTVTSSDQKIQELAGEITKHSNTENERIRLLVDWIQDNIKKEAVDAFTALDVLSQKKAECQGHAYLYTAFARALKIPTRVVNGVVYSKHFDGFLYHTWAESLVNDKWVAVDPVFNQIPADATHIKLIEGEKPSDLLPLVKVIGKLKIEIHSLKIMGE